MHCQIRGIDNAVGVSPKLRETLLFKAHTFQYREMRQKRMGPSRLRESTNQHLLTGFKEHELNRMAQYLYPLKNAYEIGKEHALPDIDAERNILYFSPLLVTQLDKGRQKGRRLKASDLAARSALE